MIKPQSVLHATLAFAAALCGYLSSASAVTNRWLDTNPATPSQLAYYGGVTDSSGSDYATANMFIGNWFGFEVAMLDVTAVWSGAPQSRYQMVLQCSSGGNQGTPIVTLPNPVAGAEGVLYCPIGAVALQSTQAILYQ